MAFDDDPTAAASTTTTTTTASSSEAVLRSDTEEEDVVDSLTQRMVEALGTTEDHEIITWSQGEKTNTMFGKERYRHAPSQIPHAFMPDIRGRFD
jgi:hypothetical protein